jgi:hypothetical protein
MSLILGGRYPLFRHHHVQEERVTCFRFLSTRSEAEDLVRRAHLLWTAPLPPIAKLASSLIHRQVKDHPLLTGEWDALKNPRASSPEVEQKMRERLNKQLLEVPALPYARAQSRTDPARAPCVE